MLSWKEATGLKSGGLLRQSLFYRHLQSRVRFEGVTTFGVFDETNVQIGGNAKFHYILLWQLSLMSLCQEQRGSSNYRVLINIIQEWLKSYPGWTRGIIDLVKPHSWGGTRAGRTRISPAGWPATLLCAFFEFHISTKSINFLAFWYC